MFWVYTDLVLFSSEHLNISLQSDHNSIYLQDVIPLYGESFDVLNPHL